MFYSIFVALLLESILYLILGKAHCTVCLSAIQFFCNGTQSREATQKAYINLCENKNASVRCYQGTIILTTFLKLLVGVKN